MQTPGLYATFLLWLLAELFERLPEVGDLGQAASWSSSSTRPTCCSTTRRRPWSRRSSRSCGSSAPRASASTSSPRTRSTSPTTVLGQLGNRVQHALRAFTPARPEGGQGRRRDLPRRTPSSTSRRPSPSSASARRWSRSSTRRAARRSSSGPSSCRRTAASAPISAAGARRRSSSGSLVCRPLREGRRPRIGLRDAQGPGPAGRRTAQAAQAQAQAEAQARPARPTAIRRRRAGRPGPIPTIPRPRRGVPAGRSRDTLMEAMAKSAARSVGGRPRPPDPPRRPGLDPRRQAG
ncbi:MAG: DUF853 domain-containing protein [Ignavibacteriales bacterium]|nr:DUF853 domain-containing protein [Ignavibacteriales bacterium]